MTPLGFVFDRVPLRANAYARHRGWQRRLWEKAAWVKLITDLCGLGPWIVKGVDGSPRTFNIDRLQPERVRLAVTMRRSKLQDEDNRWGSLKPVLDALKATGWIWDDSEAWLEIHVFEHVCKRGEESTWVVWDRIESVTLSCVEQQP